MRKLVALYIYLLFLNGYIVISYHEPFMKIWYVLNRESRNKLRKTRGIVCMKVSIILGALLLPFLLSVWTRIISIQLKIRVIIRRVPNLMAHFPLALKLYISVIPYYIYIYIYIYIY